MKKRREINKIRTDWLEAQIAYHAFQGNVVSESLLRELCVTINAPIDEEEISKRVELYRKIDEEE